MNHELFKQEVDRLYKILNDDSGNSPEIKMTSVS